MGCHRRKWPVRALCAVGLWPMTRIASYAANITNFNRSKTHYYIAELLFYLGSSLSFVIEYSSRCLFTVLVVITFLKNV